MGKKRIHISISSSIANFKDKIKKKYPCPEWSIGSIFEPTIFFGLYNPVDRFKFMIHRGPRYVFWCGGDLQTSHEFLHSFLPRFEAKHFCENSLEQEYLFVHDVYPQIRPQFFGDVNKYPVSFKPMRGQAHVFLCSHLGRNNEYGVNLVLEELAQKTPKVYYHIYGVDGKDRKNVFFHGQVSEEQFDKDIVKYHSGLRFNSLDGFSEVTAKSILLGQYPISYIPYPYIDRAHKIKDFLDLLNELPKKKKPNLVARDYWYKELCEPSLLAEVK